MHLDRRTDHPMRQLIDFGRRLLASWRLGVLAFDGEVLAVHTSAANLASAFVSGTAPCPAVSGSVMSPPDSTPALSGNAADSSVNWLPLRDVGPS